jgi:hypothetical protein
VYGHRALALSDDACGAGPPAVELPRGQWLEHAYALGAALGNQRGGGAHPFDVTSVRAEMGPAVVASMSAVRLGLTLVVGARVLWLRRVEGSKTGESIDDERLGRVKFLNFIQCSVSSDNVWWERTLSA